jgi:hypothetical protein
MLIQAGVKCVMVTRTTHDVQHEEAGKEGLEKEPA